MQELQAGLGAGSRRELQMRRGMLFKMLVRVPVPRRPLPSIWRGWMMRPPDPGAPAIEHLEIMLWRILGGRGQMIGEHRFRLLVRLVVRHWPADTLERIRRAGHWRGAERKRAGRILAARVRESAEALDEGAAEAWPIILDGTVGLIWIALCDMHYRDEQFRDRLHLLSIWVAHHGATP
jgi:hypothetical protein